MIKRRVQPYFVLNGNICAAGRKRSRQRLPLRPDRSRSRRHHHRRPRQPDRRTVAPPERDNQHDLGEIFRQIIANNRAGGWRKIKQEGR